MDDVRTRIEPHRLLATFFFGVSLTLLMTSPIGRAGTVSPGWVGLWMAAALGSAPLGGMLLLRRPWRDMPIEARRGPAMTYLANVGIDLLALAVLASSIGGASPLLFLPLLAGIGLAVLYLRLYTPAIGKREDLFP